MPQVSCTFLLRSYLFILNAHILICVFSFKNFEFFARYSNGISWMRRMIHTVSIEERVEKYQWKLQLKYMTQNTNQLTKQPANADCGIKAWLYQRFGPERQFPIHIPYEYRQKSETELLRWIKSTKRLIRFASNGGINSHWRKTKCQHNSLK